MRTNKTGITTRIRSHNGAQGNHDPSPLLDSCKGREGPSGIGHLNKKRKLNNAPSTGYWAVHGAARTRVTLDRNQEHGPSRFEPPPPKEMQAATPEHELTTPENSIYHETAAEENAPQHTIKPTATHPDKTPSSRYSWIQGVLSWCTR